jgi:uncharacterized protein YecE (DUF72 family)
MVAAVVAATHEDRLRFYASQFAVVEVDSTYYGLPSSRNASLWAERTPDGFVFDVKAYRLFTQHQRPPDALPKDIRERLAPVKKKNLYFNNCYRDNAQRNALNLQGLMNP